MIPWIQIKNITVECILISHRQPHSTPVKVSSLNLTRSQPQRGKQPLRHTPKINCNRFGIWNAISPLESPKGEPDIHPSIHPWHGLESNVAHSIIKKTGKEQRTQAGITLIPISFNIIEIHWNKDCSHLPTNNWITFLDPQKQPINNFQ